MLGNGRIKNQGKLGFMVQPNRPSTQEVEAVESEEITRACLEKEKKSQC